MNSILASSTPHQRLHQDAFERTIDYLRISVTDRCNERCLYCMPEGYAGWTPREEHLHREEILRIVEAATHLGFRKFRLTGGEPLIRRDIVEIARQIWETFGVETLGISTNGLGLKTLAQPLKEAGVRSVNISLDTLNPTDYKKLTGGDLSHVLAGIDAALSAGFECIKLNAVLLKGINDEQILPLIRFASARNCPMRFIELMPIGPHGIINDSHFFSIAEAQARITAEDVLTPCENVKIGHGPARYFHSQRHNGLVGFIGSISCSDFCATCNKMRLTADGKIRPCLGQENEVDLRQALRNGVSTVQELIELALANKPKTHFFTENFTPHRPMTAVGG